MTIEIPEKLELALKTKATLRGTSPALYVSEMLEHDLQGLLETKSAVVPYKNSRGILAKYGPAPTAEEIDENRKDMRGKAFCRGCAGPTALCGLAGSLPRPSAWAEMWPGLRP